ncbi:MAG: hypothetical protein ACTSQF_04955 [Candidatus Heimdallarchaeaceae archaeon]
MKNNSKSKQFFQILCVILIASILLLQGSSALQQREFYKNSPILDAVVPEWSFSSSELVSAGSDGNSFNQVMDIDSKGNVHVAWQELNGSYLYRVWDINTQTWQPSQIIASCTHNMFAGIGITVDDSDNVHIVWGDDTDYQSAGIDFDIFYKFWNSTSMSWNETSVVSTESNLVSFMPVVKVDSHNNAHIIWYDHTDYLGSGSDYDVFYKCWDALDMKWNTTIVVSTESGLDSKRGSMDIQSSGYLEIAWYDKTNLGTNGDDWDIFFKFYNPETEYWSSVRVISANSVNDSYHPDVYVDSKDNVHITWHDYSDIDNNGIDADIFYTFWNSTSTSWNATTVISTESDENSYLPGVVVDELQNVFISWWDLSDLGTLDIDFDIFFKYWDASGEYWNTTQVVTDDNTSDAELSENSPIDIDRWGNVHLIWEDYSDMLGAGGSDYDVFYKRLDLSSLNAPILQSISPAPSTTGNIDLQWSSVPYVDTYSVYRSDTAISSVSGLTPITIVNTIDFADLGLSDGTYYYVIVANNPYLDSTISNEESVDVEIPIVQEYPIQMLLAVGIVGLFAVVIKHKRKNIK